MTWQTLTIALILLLTKGVSTMAQISNKVCDTIPYEFVHNKIIIPVTVNGMQVKYIVDTGGITGTMWETAVKMKHSCIRCKHPIIRLSGSIHH